MADQSSVHMEDLVPVRSRISWGAILAGAMIALAVYLILTLLGGAIGLSIADNVRTSTLSTGAAIWAVASIVLALFAGGCVTSQLSVGENKKEALMYGVIVWGVVFAMFLWLVASGVRSGFNALLGISTAGATAARGTSPEDWEAAARRAGVPQERIDDWRRQARDAADSARRAAEDPDTQEAVREGAAKASWWTLAGVLLSMAAAIGGALVGAGPTFRLLTVTATGQVGIREGSREPLGAGRV